VTYFHQGRIPARNHQTRFGTNYVATYDNRLISYEQWEREAEAERNRRSGAKTVTSRDAYDECMLRAENGCGTQMNRMCAALTAGAIGLGFISFGAGTAVGAGIAASCYIVNEFGCPGIGTSYCKDKYGSAAVIGKPPSYYC